MRAIALLGVVLAAACAANDKPTEAPVAPPPVTPQETAVSSERNEGIEHVFARKVNELQACWQEEYERTKNRKLEGDVTLQIMISPQGKAGGLKVLSATLKSDAVETCIKQAVATWHFPEGTHTVPYMRTIHLGAQY